jgi:hypothetical protein
VKPGDTGSTLAQRYLGRPSAWAATAELNGLSPNDPLQVGDTLVMPVVLRHGLVRGESLVALAERYYGDSSRGRLLQSFNRVDDPHELAVGRTVEIPLITLRLAEPPAAQEPEPVREAIVKKEIEPAPAEEPPPTPAWFGQGFAEAERAYAAGDFELAGERVATLVGRVESIPLPADRARLWRLSAFVHVAFDRKDEACTAFRSLRSVESPVELDPNLVSPKIREALAACEPDGTS